MIFPALLALAQLPVTAPTVRYTESVTRADGTIEMRTRAQKLVATGKPDVWLVGAVHVGTKEYYSKLQSLLDAQTAVLFEGVKPTDGPVVPMKPDSKAPRPIYKVLSDAIGLDFQLNDIDYTRPNWLDSDLSWRQISALNKKAGNGKPTEVDAIQKLMDPNSQAVKLFTTLIQNSTPGTREAFKIMIVREIASGAGPSLDPTSNKIVVEARNEAVLTHFKTLLDTPKPPKSIGIFYGALHLPGIQHDLAAQYGYKPANEEWFTSATANPKKLDATGKAMLESFGKLAKSGAPLNLP